MGQGWYKDEVTSDEDAYGDDGVYDMCNGKNLLRHAHLSVFHQCNMYKHLERAKTATRMSHSYR